jgi:hypothetical protein
MLSTYLWKQWLKRIGGQGFSALSHLTTGIDGGASMAELERFFPLDSPTGVFVTQNRITVFMDPYGDRIRR